MVRRYEIALCPEDNLPIARLSRKAYALIYQGISKTHSTCARLNKQQPELRRLWLFRMPYQKYVPHALSIYFCDPATLPARIEIRDKVTNNVRDQSLKRFVKPIFPRVSQGLSMHDPTHVTDPVRTQSKWLISLPYVHRNSPR